MAKNPKRIDIDAEGAWVYPNAFSKAFCELEGGYASASNAEMFSWTAWIESDMNLWALKSTEPLSPNEIAALRHGATIEIGDTRSKLGMPDVWHFDIASYTWIVTTRAKRILSELFKEDVVFYSWAAPLQSHEDVVISGLWIMHVPRVLECVDEQTAKYRVNAVGKQSLIIDEFAIDASRVPSSVNLFRIHANEMSIYCRTETAKKLAQTKLRHIMFWPTKVKESTK